ncbi:hypothetical protein [Alkalihalobacillus pseudalcaliphilus]|uniref:hypothetical protein n=1 Tax=Alkalihalobacillus pseudalcaliphilus TaxID=79884 RepID=UPI00064D74C5|nr:hypothetical protein [Alkalihalobacillus pseudalcaliphilus]KMK75576.1 hypothetical protein AB990_09805 [Alkalihalobacillus pseudalcaliphilus]
MNYMPRLFIVVGSINLFIFSFVLFAAWMASSLPPAGTLIFVAMAVMGFCLSYLQPHFKENDERMRLIRYKGLFASFFATIAYFGIFNILLVTERISITALDLVQIITTLYICTVFISFVIYAKKI